MAELSDFTNESDEALDENKLKKVRIKTKMDFPLPGRSTIDQHKKILLAYVLTSRRGEKELIYTDFSESSLGFSSTTLSANNKFLESIGLLEKGSKHGYYKPTPDGIKLADYDRYEKTEDYWKLLGEIIRKSWIYESAVNLLTLKKSASLEDLIKELAHTSKADLSKHRNQVRLLIDYLENTRVIDIDSDNKVHLVPQIETLESDNSKKISELSVPQNIIDNENTLENGFKNENIKTVDPSVEVLVPNSRFVNDTIRDVKVPSSGVTINVDLSIKLEITPEMTQEDVQGKLNAIVNSLKNMN